MRAFTECPNRQADGDVRGLAAGAIMVLLKHVFEELHLRKIELRVKSQLVRRSSDPVLQEKALEDDLHYHTSLECGFDFLRTRNKKDFIDENIVTIDAEELVKIQENVR